MSSEFYFSLAAGVGLFLFAMYLLENAIHGMAGRTFKLLLQRFTQNKLAAILGGAIVTGVLQSSSMVSLMVLAFVGAGVLSMKNALAVILGANLGTTIDSWIVATLGFKLNIEFLSYPAIGLSGLAIILFSSREKIRNISQFVMGFGLLFLSIGIMKDSVEQEVKEFDFSRYTQYALWVFVVIGFIITTIIQSSSATVALTLSALNAGIITFPASAAVVIGSEVGTTLKILLGSMGGNASKRRVAFGNFIFNTFTAVLALIFIRQLLYVITDFFHLGDPLMGLVAFQSMINFISILIFLPLLNPFAAFLEKRFKDVSSGVAAFISDTNLSDTASSLELFRKEVAYCIHYTMLFNLKAFDLELSLLKKDPEFEKINRQNKFYRKSLHQQYEWLKELQGEMQAFYMQMQSKKPKRSESQQFDQLISSARSCMHAAKSVKDIHRNISDLKRSSRNIKFHFYKDLQKETASLYQQLNALLEEKVASPFEKMKKLFLEIQKNYASALDEFYRKAPKASLPDMDITTALNFNRELFTSHKAMLMAVKDFLLDAKEAEDFNEIPVYLT